MRKLAWVIVSFLILNCGCATHSKVENFYGMETPHGKPLSHIHASRFAIHLFGGWRILGNASVARVTDDFMLLAKQTGATRFQIDHADRTNFWFGFIPFTLIITPVVTTVSGDALE